MIEIPLLTIISGLFTISVRLTGLMLFAPFFGSMVIPTRVKAILVLALTLLLFPAVGKQIDLHSNSEWPLLVFTEFLIGVGMGIATNIVFEAVQLTGQVLGIQMGYSLVNILDPQTQVDTTVVAMFYQSIVMLLFLQMDVHFWLLRAVGYRGAIQDSWRDLWARSSNRCAGPFGHAGRGHHPRTARQSLTADAADAAWTGH